MVPIIRGQILKHRKFQEISQNVANAIAQKPEAQVHINKPKHI